LKLIKELDTKAQGLAAQLEEKQNNYLNHLKSSKDRKQEIQKPENQLILDEIRKLQAECLALSKEKFDIARQNYEIVDYYIEKLDDDLKKFEDEIKGQADELKGFQEDTSVKETGGGKRNKAKFDSKYIKNKNKMASTLKASDKHSINAALAVGNEVLDPANTPVDKNEPKYCYCNGFSYGDMISCDNPFCEKEWFHFQCINITTKPKGKWYCRECKTLKQKDMLKF